MSAIHSPVLDATRGELPADADTAVRQLYSRHAQALHSYVLRFCPDPGADDIMQETFIRAWRHLPRLITDDRPVRPWLFRVARNLLTDPGRVDPMAGRGRPMRLAGAVRKAGT